MCNYDWYYIGKLIIQQLAWVCFRIWLIMHVKYESLIGIRIAKFQGGGDTYSVGWKWGIYRCLKIRKSENFFLYFAFKIHVYNVNCKFLYETVSKSEVY